MTGLIRKTIVVDTNGLYFTNNILNDYWSKDPDNAYHFEGHKEVIEKFDEPIDHLYLIKGVGPFEFKKIYTHEKHDSKKG